MRPLILAVLLGACSTESPPAEEPATEEPPAEEAAPSKAKAKAEPRTDADVPNDEGELDIPDDALVITTVKKGTVENRHTMTVSAEGLEFGTPGDLSTLGGALLIDTSSWSSPIEPRDVRVRQMFFQAEAHPTARFEIEAVEGLSRVKPEATATGTVRGQLKLLDASHPLSAGIEVRRSEAGYRVELAEPITIKASDLGLSTALSEVAEACGVELADATEVEAAFTIPRQR